MTKRPPHNRNEEEARDQKAGPPTTGFTFCSAVRRASAREHRFGSSLASGSVRCSLCPSRHRPQSVAPCLSIVVGRILSRMGTKSRETIYGASVRAAADRATERARKPTGPCEAWNKRMLGFQGPAQPSPLLGDAISAGYRYLEVKCLGCDTHQTVALDIVRRPKATPINELERYMRCQPVLRSPGLSYKRSHLVALRVFENRKKELANRPLIGEQAFGEAHDPNKLERLGR